MHAQFHRYATARRHVARGRATAVLSAAAISVSLAAALLTLPVASANASPSNPSIAIPATVSALPTGEVEKLLADIPISDLNKVQLTEALSKLPGLSTLPANKLKEALTQVVETLTNKGATIGKLLTPTEIVPTLESLLKNLLSPTELLSLLKGENLATELTNALGSLDPSQLLGALLSSSDTPEQLLTQLFATLNPEALLGTTLTGETFSKMTVGELASDLGMSAGTLANDLGVTITELPETADALTAPLLDGKTLAVLNGLGGVTLGLLNGSESKETSKEGKETSEETSKEVTKEGGSSQSKETTKEAGANNGSNGSFPTGSGATTVLVTLPSALAVAPQSSLATSAGTKKQPGKVKILSHRVRGKVVTLVVQVPAAERSHWAAATYGQCTVKRPRPSVSPCVRFSQRPAPHLYASIIIRCESSSKRPSRSPVDRAPQQPPRSSSAEAPEC
jgi:hypothetical protein